jgi:hypothetical protein
MDILSQALDVVEEVESHASDLDRYDVLAVASQIAAIECLEYDFDPRKG